jgi:hypothetical protein
LCDAGGGGGETEYDGGCRYKVGGCGIDNAIRFTAVVYDMGCQFDKVFPTPFRMSVDVRRDEKSINGYVVRKRQVSPPAVLALYTPDIITAACQDVLSGDT